MKDSSFLVSSPLVNLPYSWLYLWYFDVDVHQYTTEYLLYMKTDFLKVQFSPLCLPPPLTSLLSSSRSSLPSDISTLQGNISQYNITLTRDWDVSKAEQNTRPDPWLKNGKMTRMWEKTKQKNIYNEAFLFCVYVCVIFLNQWDLKCVCETLRVQRWTSEHKLPPEGITQHSSVE